MIDPTALLTGLLPTLNASSFADLVFWTEADLTEWLDECAKRLARTAGIWVERSTSFTAPGVSTYILPSGHLSVIHVSVAGVMLAPSTHAELVALSDSWQTDTGAPERWIPDAQGLETIMLHPQPQDLAVLELIEHTAPDGSAIEAPAVVADCLALRVLAEARRKEGDGALPEIAAAAEAQASLYEQAFRAYYGEVF